MISRRDRLMIDELVADILVAMGKAERQNLPEYALAGEEIKSLAHVDYAGLLRKHLGRCEVEQVLAEARKRIWPDWNHKAGRTGPIKEFVTTYSRLGIDVRPIRLSGPNGLALLGFYAGKRKGVFQRPMICVNTAHHPGIVAAAFAHEMGHHLIEEMFDARNQPTRFLLYTGFAKHLEDPPELAADVLVSIGAYPLDTVRRIFSRPGEDKLAGHSGQEITDSAFVKNALDYLAGCYGVNLSAISSARRKLQYLATMIHYTNLRKALFDEYDL